MTQYIVYGLSASALGDPVTEEDCAQAQRFVNEALDEAGLSDRAHVVIGEGWDRHTFLPSEELDPELHEAVNQGIERFYASI